MSNVSWNKQKLPQTENDPEGFPNRNRLTCCHDARGGNRENCDVLRAVRRVEVCCTTRLPSSICLGPRCGDGEKSCLVVGCRWRREGCTLFLLLFHLVQEHGILNLTEVRRFFTLLTTLGLFSSHKTKQQPHGWLIKLGSVVQSYLSWHSRDGRPEIWWIKMRILHHFCNKTKATTVS